MGAQTTAAHPQGFLESCPHSVSVYSAFGHHVPPKPDSPANPCVPAAARDWLESGLEVRCLSVVQCLSQPRTMSQLAQRLPSQAAWDTAFGKRAADLGENDCAPLTHWSLPKRPWKPSTLTRRPASRSRRRALHAPRSPRGLRPLLGPAVDPGALPAAPAAACHKRPDALCLCVPAPLRPEMPWVLSADAPADASAAPPAGGVRRRLQQRHRPRRPQPRRSRHRGAHSPRHTVRDGPPSRCAFFEGTNVLLIIPPRSTPRTRRSPRTPSPGPPPPPPRTPSTPAATATPSASWPTRRPSAATAPG